MTEAEKLALRCKEWFTSDLHIGHANIIKYTERPYGSVDEMNADLVRRWNETVAPEDEVYVLGDVAMGKLDESLAVIGQLNGYKYLMPGNHDRMFECEGTKYANAIQRYIDGGFKRILDDQTSFRIDGLHVLACHFPYVGDHEHEQYEDRYQEKRPVDKGSFLVHGHTHGQWRKRGRMIDVGVDAWGGYPVAFETVAELFASDGDADVLEWSR